MTRIKHYLNKLRSTKRSIYTVDGCRLLPRTGIGPGPFRFDQTLAGEKAGGENHNRVGI